jgi:hypothetical protein
VFIDADARLGREFMPSSVHAFLSSCLPQFMPSQSVPSSVHAFPVRALTSDPSVFQGAADVIIGDPAVPPAEPTSFHGNKRVDDIMKSETGRHAPSSMSGRQHLSADRRAARRARTPPNHEPSRDARVHGGPVDTRRGKPPKAHHHVETRTVDKN